MSEIMLANPQQSSPSPRLGKGIIFLCVITLLLALGFYAPFISIRMIQHGDIIPALIRSAATAAFLAAAIIPLLSRTAFSCRTSGILLLAGSLAILSTLDVYGGAIPALYPNGDIGSAFTISFEFGLYRLGGISALVLAAIFLAVFIKKRISSGEQRFMQSAGTPGRRVGSISLFLAMVFLVAFPFIYAHIYESYIYPSQQGKALEDFNQRNPKAAEAFKSRGLEYSHQNLSIQGGCVHIPYKDWDISYEPELEYVKAREIDDQVDVMVLEKDSRGVSGIGFDNPNYVKIIVLVKCINMRTLDSISAFMDSGDFPVSSGVYEFENDALHVFGGDIAQLKEESFERHPYRGRGFGHEPGVLAGNSWKDSKGLDWSLYIQGEGESYAATYVLNDDGSTVKSTFIVAEQDADIEEKANTTIKRVDFLDADAIESFHDEAERALV